MGEYDDIKHLVRDGSKKLKDAEGLPDESLLAINRPRCSSDGSRQQQGGPFYIQDGHQHSQNPSSSRSKYQQRSSSRSSRLNSSVPPKLKSHPRDTISSRYHASTPTANTSSSNRHSASQHQSSRGTSGGNPTITGTNNNVKFPNVPHQCSEFNIFGAGDNDWSEALNFSKGFNSLWNCGASGAETGGEGHHHNAHHQYERESSGRQTRRVRSYSNEEFRAMKQQQQSRYKNAVVNLEGREDMVIDQQQPSQHGCFGATSSKHSSRYSHHIGMNYGSSAPHHHNSNGRASATSASNRSSAGNDVILV